MVAAKIATLERGDKQHSSIELTSQSEAADLLNVGRASVQRAKLVLDEGVPSLFDALETERQHPLQRSESGGFPYNEQSTQLGDPLSPGEVGKDPCRLLYDSALLLPQPAKSQCISNKCTRPRAEHGNARTPYGAGIRAPL
jgi:hypothetical protein